MMVGPEVVTRIEAGQERVICSVEELTKPGKFKEQRLATS